MPCAVSTACCPRAWRVPGAGGCGAVVAQDVPHSSLRTRWLPLPLLCVVAHRNFNLRSEVIGSMVCDEGTAELMRPKLEYILERIGFDIKNAYPTTDAGQPMPALFADMKARWVRCFSHLSQNAVTAARGKNDDFKRLMTVRGVPLCCFS